MIKAELTVEKISSGEYVIYFPVNCQIRNILINEETAKNLKSALFGVIHDGHKMVSRQWDVKSEFENQ